MQTFLSTLTLIQAASKWYTGDNRPYEFGFKLEGNQHRHESKGSIKPMSEMDDTKEINIFLQISTDLLWESLDLSRQMMFIM